MFSICFIHVLHIWFLNFKDCFQLVFHGFSPQFICLLRVDTWLKLDTQMLAPILGLSKTPITYKRKFNSISKQFKDDKIVNKVSSNDRHECPFYDALDSRWRWNENVMKHVNDFANETEKIISSQEFQIDFDSASKNEGSKEAMEKPFTLDEVKKQNKKQMFNVYEHFSTMAKTNTSMSYNNLLQPMFYS